MVDMARLAPGEQVEVVSEKIEGSALRYALTVHAIPARRYPARPASADRAPRCGGKIALCRMEVSR